MPSYSKKLVSIDPSSYHRLGLALTESHIDTGSQFKNLNVKIELKNK